MPDALAKARAIYREAQTRSPQAKRIQHSEARVGDLNCEMKSSLCWLMLPLAEPFISCIGVERG